MSDTITTVDTECAALLGCLNQQRQHVLGALEGLSDDDLRRAVLPSGWTFLSLVQHLTLDVEQFWFETIMGLDDADPDTDSTAWQVCEDSPAEAVLDAYRAAIEVADAVITSTAVTAPPRRWPVRWADWHLPDLRAVLLHVIAETACHAGHIDAARELVDGVQWMAFD